MITIRDAEISDCRAIVSLLAKLHSIPESRCTDEAVSEMENILFTKGHGGATIGYSGDEPFAVGIYCYTYSSSDLKKAMFIETIYVDPDYRGAGIGKYMLQNFAQKAESAGCSRLEWRCSDSDTKAQKFYENSGAKKDDTHRVYFVGESELHEFGEFKCSCCSGECSGDCSECQG